MVALCSPYNTAAHLAEARGLRANGLIAKAHVYPVNATQLGQFLDRFLCPQLAGEAPWAAMMKNPPTRVQRAVTKFAAFGTRVISHRPGRPEPVYFQGPAFSNSRFSLVVCNQPAYLAMAIEGYRRRREVPIRPKRVLEPQVFVSQSVKRKKDEDGQAACPSGPIDQAPALRMSSLPQGALDSNEDPALTELLLGIDLDNDDALGAQSSIQDQRIVRFEGNGAEQTL